MSEYNASVESRLEESWHFVKELWAKADPTWLVEIDLLQYRPTQENPDDQRMRGVFYTVAQTLHDWPQIFNVLEGFNRTQVENVHHAVNPRFQKPKKLGKNTDVSHYVAVWIDLDFKGNETGIRKHFAETVELLKAQNLEPSAIIESGRGLHGYWFFDMPYPASDARPVCAGIQDFFQLSDTVHDPRRVLRMPGFINLKEPKDPKWCRVVEGTWKRYSILDFKDFVVEPSKSDEDKELEELEANKPKTFSKDPKIEEIKKGVPESGGPYGGRHQAAVALAGHYAVKLVVKKVLNYSMQEWNKLNTPPLPEEEIETIVEDIWLKEQVKKAEQKADGKTAKDAHDAEKAQKKASAPWFNEEGDFNPAIMANHFRTELHMLSTPISRDGRGIDLYLYKDGVYKVNGAEFVRSETARLLGPQSRDGRIDEVVKLVTEFTKVQYAKINQQAKTLINVKNGMLDWKTGKLQPHDPKLLSITQIGTEFNPAAVSPDLDQFMTAIFPPDCIALVEEFLGYMLIPSTALQKAFVAIGAGGNGKGTFLKIVKCLLGEENVSAISLHSIEEDRFATAALIGKLANIYHDLDPRILQSTGKFKSIVSGDPIGAEQKFKDHYTFEPYARLVFSANEFPRSADKTEAYFDRLIFVEFPHKFRGTSDQILDYDQILVQKPGLLSALLNRALAGLQRLMTAQRFSLSKTSQDAIEAYKRECSNALDFMVDNCVRHPSGSITRKELYERYVGWCGDQGVRPVSAKNFVKTVRDFGATEHKTDGVRIWTGVVWMSGKPPDTTDNDIKLFAPESASDDQGPGHMDPRDVDF
jgi:putative DNA primase/helicase